jgi:hypothetical protein
MIRALGAEQPFVGSALNCEPHNVPLVVSLAVSLADRNCGVAPIRCQLIVAENNLQSAICTTKMAWTKNADSACPIQRTIISFQKIG